MKYIMNKICSQNHTCFCCNFSFNSGYTGQGDKFCATCRIELTNYYGKLWAETFDKSFQQKGKFKHKLFTWKKNNDVTIMIGAQKVKNPNSDFVFFHYVKRVFKYKCIDNNYCGCHRRFFSFDEINECPYCNKKIFATPKVRWMICCDSKGSVTCDIPEIQVTPVIDIIENWVSIYDFSETFFLSEIILLYLTIQNKNNFINNELAKKEYIPKATSAKLLKCDSEMSISSNNSECTLSRFNSNSSLELVKNKESDIIKSESKSDFKKVESLPKINQGSPTIRTRKKIYHSEEKDPFINGAINF